MMIVYKDNIDEDKFVSTLTKQYTTAVKSLNDLFKIAPDLCYEDDGIGCCSLDTETSKRGIVGPVRDKILELRKSKLEEVEIEEHNACDYHKWGNGCILGDLKSPICIASYCKGDIEKTSYDWEYVFDSLKYLLNTETSTGNLNEKVKDGWRIVNEIQEYSRNIKKELSLLDDGSVEII